MIRTVALAALAAAVAVVAFAQSGQEPTPPPSQANEQVGTLNFQTNIGSFKILGVANQPALGRVVVTFTGSILISDLKGQLSVSPTLVKEYEGHGKQVYFGTGSVTIDGTFRSIQWFGRDMKATWVGKGVVRLFGEFDKNLETGKYWFNDPTRAVAWGQGGQTVVLPNAQSRIVNPVERGKGGSGGG